MRHDLSENDGLRLTEEGFDFAVSVYSGVTKLSPEYGKVNFYQWNKTNSLDMETGQIIQDSKKEKFESVDCHTKEKY